MHMHDPVDIIKKVPVYYAFRMHTQSIKLMHAEEFRYNTYSNPCTLENHSTTDLYYDATNS